MLSAGVALVLTACGGSEGGSNFTLGAGGSGSNQTGTVSFGVSDFPVDDADEVVIEIDKITLKKAGNDDVVIDRFTIPALTLDDVDSFQINLLDYQGSEQEIVIDELEVSAGDYTDIILSILDEDINNSYVLETSGAQKEIKVPSDTLKLGAFTVNVGDVQTFTIEFDLRQAMTYRPGPDVYNLKPRGIRLQDNDNDRKISGTVDPSLFDTEQACASKVEPTEGNVVYLYQGHGLNVGDLADVFDPDDDLSTTIPANAIAPFAVSTVTNTNNEWVYEFAFLPSGDYTLVFSCAAEDDNSVQYDGISIPLPADQLLEVTAETVNVDCDLPIVDGSCS
jgi:hypothetical protein